jgi:hypothetical protein
VTSNYELLLVITLSETRFITRISSEPVPYFHVPHRLTRILEASVYDGNDPSRGEPRRGFGGVPDTCRVILWIMKTSGCIREYYMRYLDEANFAPTMGEPRSPCCDRCTGFENLDPRLGQMLPEFGASKIMGENSPDNFGKLEALGVPAEHDPNVRGNTQSGKYRVSADQCHGVGRDINVQCV